MGLNKEEFDEFTKVHVTFGFVSLILTFVDLSR